MKKLILAVLVGAVSLPIYAKQEKPQCTEVIQACEDTLAICDEIINSCDRALESRRLQDEARRKIIEAQESQIKDLSEKANHSHLPIVAGTSTFWVLLLLLL